jgi:hypothetical protein
MKLGFIIKKCQDLDEKLFWQFYDQGVISWIENNYHIENEDYKYCVARENIKLVCDCLKYQIPFFIDLNRKEGDPEIENIFEIKTGQPEIDWHILLKNDLKRNVIECNREELPKFIARNYFFKTKLKHYAFKGANDFVKRQLKNGKEYGKWCYALEDRNIKIENFLANPINYPEAIIDMLPPCDKFLVSPLVDFNLENEIRVIFCGSKVASIASKHDYKNIAMRAKFFYYFAKKYGSKVPYKIWSVDFHKCKDGYDIVEAHFDCALLGKFFGNQNYKSLFEIFYLESLS